MILEVTEGLDPESRGETKILKEDLHISAEKRHDRQRTFTQFNTTVHDGLLIVLP